MMWQPIETAPDGVEVDLFVGGKRHTNFYKDKHGRWCRKEGYPTVTRVLLEEPTHWMPPPEPPANEP